ncbi:MAG: hypothetical protein OXC54_12190 [Rhodospirillaceae bacterium]|nr:hypothetical protein [Rhodospirillaceae bacterium]MCY4312046.1 hypothetical protein [Rhodospirillaceae bacterium]
MAATGKHSIDLAFDLVGRECTTSHCASWPMKAGGGAFPGVAQHRGQLIDTIQPNQCRNDIQNARYASVQNRYALARVERFAAATALERWR